MQATVRNGKEALCTSVGRVRAKMAYSSARNNLFQRTDASGNKLVAWELLKAGYLVEAFIHDEFLVSIDRFMACTETAKDIERICCETMQQLTGSVPIETEFALCKRWLKGAEAVYDEAGNLLEWEAEQL